MEYYTLKERKEWLATLEIVGNPEPRKISILEMIWDELAFLDTLEVMGEIDQEGIDRLPHLREREEWFHAVEVVGLENDPRELEKVLLELKNLNSKFLKCTS